jgi:hypothetical protein
MATRENSENEVYRSQEGEIATRDRTTNDSEKEKSGGDAGHDLRSRVYSH